MFCMHISAVYFKRISFFHHPASQEPIYSPLGVMSPQLRTHMLERGRELHPSEGKLGCNSSH